MPTPLDPRPIEEVPVDIIRQIFNNDRYFEKASSGEIKTRLKRNSHLENPPLTEPHCTHSQIVFYHSQDDEPLAIIHQYYRPDGTLGGCGQPDPKRLYLPDRIIYVRST